MSYCGVIEKATGNLIRAGYCDFTGQYDTETHEQREDVPAPGKICSTNLPGKVTATYFHRWNGSAWIEVAF